MDDSSPCDDRARALPPSLLHEDVARRLTEHAVAMARRGAHTSFHDSCDLAQDVLVTLLEKLKEGVRIHDPFAWIVVAVRARRVDEFRSHMVRARLSTARVRAPMPTHHAGGRLDVWQQLEDMLAAVRPQLAEPDKVVLRGLAAGLTRQTIAASAAEKVTSVKRRARKALDRVRVFVRHHEWHPV